LRIQKTTLIGLVSQYLSKGFLEQPKCFVFIAHSLFYLIEELIWFQTFSECFKMNLK